MTSVVKSDAPAPVAKPEPARQTAPSETAPQHGNAPGELIAAYDFLREIARRRRASEREQSAT